MSLIPQDGHIRLTNDRGEVVYEGPGTINLDQVTDEEAAVVPSNLDSDPTIPLRLTFDDVIERNRPRGPSMAEVNRFVNVYGTDPGSIQRLYELYEQGRMPPEDAQLLQDIQAQIEQLTRRVRAGQRMISEAYSLPPEVLGVRPEYDELIRSARETFPYDPYDYGRIHPSGPSSWTPPDDPDEVIPSCPA